MPCFYALIMSSEFKMFLVFTQSFCNIYFVWLCELVMISNANVGTDLSFVHIKVSKVIFGILNNIFKIYHYETDSVELSEKIELIWKR